MRQVVPSGWYRSFRGDDRPCCYSPWKMAATFHSTFKIIGGDSDGREVLIPRILLRPQDNTRQPCEWQRLQFPVKVDYAMTISKSQGQSLDRAGICLWTPVFTHGQLYVASSRTGSSDSTMCAVRTPEGMEPFVTKNIVFREILP